MSNVISIEKLNKIDNDLANAKYSVGDIVKSSSLENGTIPYKYIGVDEEYAILSGPKTKKKIKIKAVYLEKYNTPLLSIGDFVELREARYARDMDEKQLNKQYYTDIGVLNLLKKNEIYMITNIKDNEIYLSSEIGIELPVNILDIHLIAKNQINTNNNLPAYTLYSNIKNETNLKLQKLNELYATELSTILSDTRKEASDIEKTIQTEFLLQSEKVYNTKIDIITIEKNKTINALENQLKSQGYLPANTINSYENISKKGINFAFSENYIIAYKHVEIPVSTFFKSGSGQLEEIPEHLRYILKGTLKIYYNKQTYFSSEFTNDEYSSSGFHYSPNVCLGSISSDIHKLKLTLNEVELAFSQIEELLQTVDANSPYRVSSNITNPEYRFQCWLNQYTNKVIKYDSI